MTNIEQKAKQIVTPIIESLGYEVVEVSFKKSYGQDTLEVLIFQEQGITLDDCAKVNDALDAPLEEHDITSGAPYNLNISSIGLDRPLTTVRDYQRRTGSIIEVKLRQPHNDKYKVVGKLVAVNEDSIQLDIKGEQSTIKMENIKNAVPHIDFGGYNG